MLDYFTHFWKPPQTPRPTTRLTLDPVKLLWLHQSLQPFFRLSLNVIREASTYLHSTALLLSVTPTELLLRHVLTRGTQQVKLTEELDLKGNWVLVSLPYEAVLLLASGDGKQGQIVSLQGRVDAIPQSIASHDYPGAIYVPYKRCVYVFGGNTSNCEVFQLNAWNWLALPCLSAPRVYSTPCLHRGFIYICGGFCLSLDIFSPETLTFLQSPSLSLPEFSSETLSLSINDWILIISENCTCRYLPVSNMIEIVCNSGLSPWSLPKHYVVVGTWLYFEVPGGGVACGDVMTGDYRRLKAG